jgi:hypothetical protein
MKKLLFLFLLIPQLAFSQYTASNGKTYNVGDTITIGKGTAVNGGFLYIQQYGFAAFTVIDGGGTLDDLNMSRQYAGLKAVIKKTVIIKPAGQEKTCFIIRMKPFNYIIYVESAIESGEIK